MPFDPSYIHKYYFKLFAYLPTTLLVAFSSIIIGFIACVLLSYIKYFHIRGITGIVSGFTSFIRGTPPITQLLIWFYLLLSISTALGGEISPNTCAVVALSVNCAVFMSDAFITALYAVDPGQTDAAYSIGMTRFCALRKVLLPQALPIAMPNLLNVRFIIFKESSIVFVIGVVEVVSGARMLSSMNDRTLEGYIAAALVFIPICLLIMLVMRIVEKRSAEMRR